MLYLIVSIDTAHKQQLMMQLNLFFVCDFLLFYWHTPNQQPKPVEQYNFYINCGISSMILRVLTDN